MSNNKEIGIEISSTEFNCELDKYIVYMDSCDNLKIQDFIIIARIYNTIEMNNLNDTKESYKIFINKFTSKYLNLVIKGLEATLTKGMCYYSKKYDLFIGGEPHNNSMYRIIQDKK